MSHTNQQIASQVAHLERQIAMLRGGVSENEREALAKAQHRADSVSALFGTTASSPALGESSVTYRKRIAAGFQQYSPDLKNARLDSLDLPTLAALEDRIYGDAVLAARNGNLSPGQLREVRERDASGRLITKSYGDPMAWMAPFMGQGASGRINARPNADR